MGKSNTSTPSRIPALCFHLTSLLPSDLLFVLSKSELEYKLSLVLDCTRRFPRLELYLHLILTIWYSLSNRSRVRLRSRSCNFDNCNLRSWLLVSCGKVLGAFESRKAQTIRLGRSKTNSSFRNP